MHSKYLFFVYSQIKMNKSKVSKCESHWTHN